MTARRDPDRLITAYLEDGPMELPDRAYDAVRAQIDNTRQRVVLGPWRVPDMTNFARYGIAAAAIVVVAVLGFNLLPKQAGPGGPTATASAPPTASPSPGPTPSASSAAVRLPSVGDLAAGTYFIEDSLPLADALHIHGSAGWQPGLRLPHQARRRPGGDDDTGS